MKYITIASIMAAAISAGAVSARADEDNQVTWMYRYMQQSALNEIADGVQAQNLANWQRDQQARRDCERQEQEDRWRENTARIERERDRALGCDCDDSSQRRGGHYIPTLQSIGGRVYGAH